MGIGKISIKPTRHYETCHNDVEWDLIITAILSPNKVKPNKRHGKNRFTYIKRFKQFIVEIHVEKDPIEEIIWVINAFKIRR